MKNIEKQKSNEVEKLTDKLVIKETISSFSIKDFHNVIKKYELNKSKKP